MKKIGKIIENIIVFLSAVIVLFFVAMIVLPKFNYGLIIIRSGSMEPTIKTGSIVFTKSENHYKKGDIITFNSENHSLVTHRIVESNNDKYTTKGDNNNTTDDFVVPRRAVKGKMLFTVPYVGYLLSFLHSRLGIILLIVIVAGYIIGGEVIKIWRELKKRKTEG